MKKIALILGKILELQLFLSVISLIIIAYWGLPLSFVAPISNIIFSPILTAFLVLSSLIFFLELFCIPNEWLIYLLELLTHTWSNIMALANRSWTINVSKPSTLFALLTLVSTCAILQSKHLKSPSRRIGSLTLLIAGILIYLGHTQLPTQDIQTVTIGKKTATIIYTQGTIAIIDHGALAQQACTKGWLTFTLLPLLRQTYATATITHLIAPRPTVRTLQTLNELCSLTVVKNVYLPYWKGTTPRNLGRAYIIARNNLKDQKGILQRIGKKKIHIQLGPTSSIQLSAQKHLNKYQTIHYPDIEVTCILSNKIIPLDSAKREH